MNLLAYFATTFGIMMALGYFPQAWKMYRTKSVKDISPFSFLIFFVGNLTWEIYGFSINNWPLIISPLFGLVGAGLVLLLYFIHNENK